MQKRIWTTAAVLTLTLTASTALAQNGQSTTAKGSTPNGKPFQQIQSQFAAVDEQLNVMNQQIQALQTQIESVETSLQEQITTINGTLSSLQDQITDAAVAASSLEARVTANEAAISALNAAIAALQAQLAAAEALIDGNTGDVTALKAQVTSIQALIGAHTSQISALQQQSAAINLFLANLVNGSCQTGSAIKDIAPGGFIACTQTGGNLQTLNMSAWYYLRYGFNHATVSCPAGYAATGSGFSLPSYYESTATVSNMGYNYYWYPTTHYDYYNSGWSYSYRTYTTYDRYTVPYWNTSYVNKSPLSVTANTVWGNTATLQLQFTPNYFYGYSYQVSVSCAKTQ